MVSTNFSIVILAAGSSSRLGEPKQLIDYQGTILLIRQVELALSLTRDVTVVLGYQAQQFREILTSYSITIVENKQWQQGMGSSIACGVQQCIDASAVLLLLVDQWQIEREDLTNLVQRWQEQPQKIHACSWQGVESKKDDRQIGPPVIFPKAFFTKLIRLNGEKGAKPMLVKHKEHVAVHLAPNAQYDLDTQSQLAAMQMHLKQ